MIEKNNKYLFFINPDDKKNTGNTNCVELTYPVEADISLPSPHEESKKFIPEEAILSYFK